jgi:hypothetical protein
MRQPIGSSLVPEKKKLRLHKELIRTLSEGSLSTIGGGLEVLELTLVGVCTQSYDMICSPPELTGACG